MESRTRWAMIGTPSAHKFSTSYFLLKIHFRKIKMTSVGSNQVVRGNGRNVVGSNCKVYGNYNNVVGSNCVVVGDHNNVVGSGCTAEGNHNTLTGVNCRIIGEGIGNKIIKGQTTTNTFLYVHYGRRRGGVLLQVKERRQHPLLRAKNNKHHIYNIHVCGCN